MISAPTSIELFQLSNETENYLDGLWRSVCEGKRIEEASCFCRWLRFGHVVDILRRNECPGPLPVNASRIEFKLKQILDRIGDKPATTGEAYEKSEIADIKRKLDELLARAA